MASMREVTVNSLWTARVCGLPAVVRVVGICKDPTTHRTRFKLVNVKTGRELPKSRTASFLRVRVNAPENEVGKVVVPPPVHPCPDIDEMLREARALSNAAVAWGNRALRKDDPEAKFHEVLKAHNSSVLATAALKDACMGLNKARQQPPAPAPETKQTEEQTGARGPCSAVTPSGLACCRPAGHEQIGLPHITADRVFYW